MKSTSRASGDWVDGDADMGKTLLAKGKSLLPVGMNEIYSPRRWKFFRKSFPSGRIFKKNLILAQYFF
jgi:hypothetical protein